MPEPAMRDEDVPDELVEIMVNTAFDAPPKASLWRVYQAILAAVLPAHEAMVLARVSEQVEVAPVCETDQPFMSLLARHLRGEDVSGEVAPGGQVIVPVPELERRVRAEAAQEVKAMMLNLSAQEPEVPSPCTEADTHSCHQVGAEWAFRMAIKILEGS
jgi:hypothetical protein